MIEAINKADDAMATIVAPILVAISSRVLNKDNPDAPWFLKGVANVSNIISLISACTKGITNLMGDDKEYPYRNPMLNSLTFLSLGVGLGANFCNIIYSKILSKPQDPQAITDAKCLIRSYYNNKSMENARR